MYLLQQRRDESTVTFFDKQKAPPERRDEGNTNSIFCIITIFKPLLLVQTN